jgi:hypothetical protein
MRYNNIEVSTWELIEPDMREKNIGNIIGIPNKYIDELLYSHLGNSPMIIQLSTDNENIHLCASFEIIEIDFIVMPYWLLSKLNLQPFISTISIENMNNLEIVDYIKIIANDSRYSQWDEVQYTLENILSSHNAINKGDQLNILGVEFYVLELKNKNGLNIDRGSIFNTDVKIEFDIPMDYITKQPTEKNIPIQSNIEKSALSWTLIFDEGMPVINKPDYTQKEEDTFKGTGHSLK